MKVPRRRIAGILSNRLESTDTDTAALSRQVAAYLLETNRTGEVDSLARDIMQHRADERGIVEVTALSAHQLSPEAKEGIRATIREIYPDAKRIIINESLDSDIVGGVRLVLANEQLDLSVRGRLNRFKQLTTAGKD